MTILVGMGYGLMGAGPMSFDDVQPVPLVQPVIPPLPQVPSAFYWDASTRGFQLLPNGTFQPVHPIDQMVEMLLTIEQGSVPALGPVGQRYRQRLLGVPRNKAYSVAFDETNVALAALIASGDVTVVSVVVSFPTNTGGWVISVNYQNNRLPASSSIPTQTVTVTP